MESTWIWIAAAAGIAYFATRPRSTSLEFPSDDEFLGQYFTVDDLTRAKVQALQGSGPNEAQLAQLRRLVELVLDPLREAWGGPIIVTGGWRSKKTNERIGGSESSAHMWGGGADIAPRPGDVKDLFSTLIYDRNIMQHIDQAILYSGHVHVALAKPGDTPRQMVIFDGGESK